LDRERREVEEEGWRARPGIGNAEGEEKKALSGKKNLCSLKKKKIDPAVLLEGSFPRARALARLLAV